jgi:hypothetical protein
VITITPITNSFWEELNKNTSPCGHHLKHGETLLRCKMVNGSTFKLIKIISFNPFDANRTCKFLCSLADKHKITILGIAYPTLVGPSVTKTDKFFLGMNQEKLLKWYKKFGCEIIEIDGKHHVKRSPK